MESLAACVDYSSNTKHTEVMSMYNTVMKMTSFAAYILGLFITHDAGLATALNN